MVTMATDDYNPPPAPRSLHVDDDDSSSTSFFSNSDASMVWETTPPNSPQNTTHKISHVEDSSSIDKSTGKMSLDFIAPGGRSGSISSTYFQSLPSPVPSSPGSPSLPKRPSLESNVHSQRTTLQFILPSLERFPPVDLTTARSASRPTRSSIPPFAAPTPQPAAPPPPPRRPPPWQPRLDTAGQRAASAAGARAAPRAAHRADRHPYDAEEKYAIIYLREVRHLRWEAVAGRFAALFPAGRPRRCAVPASPFAEAAAAAAAADGAPAARAALPPRYAGRNVQGLQCRWYRIRDEEGLAKLRGGWAAGGGAGAAARRERRVLEEMERAGVVGDTFLALLKGRGGMAS